MKLRNYLENIAGIGIYPVITLLIFFIFFSILTYWVVKSRNKQFEAINNLPLDGNDHPGQSVN